MRDFVTFCGVQFEVIQVQQPTDEGQMVDAVADGETLQLFVRRGLSPDEWTSAKRRLRRQVASLLSRDPLPA